MMPSANGDLGAQQPAKKRRNRSHSRNNTAKPLSDAGEPLAAVTGDERDQLHEEQQLLSLHRLRSIDWEPTAVVATATSEDGTILAAARDSGAIDLYETEHWTRLTVCFSVAQKALHHCRSPASLTVVCIWQTLAGSRELALTCLAWLRDESLLSDWRLFSGGLDGSLTEWDIAGRKPKQRTDALGGAVWGMAVRPAQGELLISGCRLSTGP